jgi:hypothetical protein
MLTTRHIKETQPAETVAIPIHLSQLQVKKLCLISTDEEGSENDAQCLYNWQFFWEDKGWENGCPALNVVNGAMIECAGEREVSVSTAGVICV